MINDGGPAYPNTVRKEEKFMDEQGYGRVRIVYETRGGQSLRDAFAMAAMQGMFACEANPRVGAEVEPWNGCESHCNGVAKMAYRLADAMLTAREANKTQ